LPFPTQSGLVPYLKTFLSQCHNPIICAQNSRRDAFISQRSNRLTRFMILPQDMNCLPSMCSFEVNATGVLRRTGGSLCGDPQCATLSFSGMDITSISEGTFQDMVHLKVLDLSNNLLVSIKHDDLKDLTALQTLVLMGNSISTIEEGTFEGLSSLEILGLDGNPIASIAAGSFAGLSGLKVMNLAGSAADQRLRIIADGAFSGTPQLQTLDLSGHSLAVIQNGTFGGDLRNLVTLDLGDRRNPQVYDSVTGRYEYVYGDLQIEPDAFAHMSALKYLNLERNQISDEFLAPGLFRHCGNLEALVLRNNELTKIAGSYFVGLKDSLQHLDLGHNKIVVFFGSAIYGFSRLDSLHLFANDLTMLPFDMFSNLNKTRIGWGGAELRGNAWTCLPDRAGHWFVLGNVYSGDALPPCSSEVGLLPQTQLESVYCLTLLLYFPSILDAAFPTIK
jgi:hypothetical protein